MAHARATIGTTNYAVAISAGHHQLNADEAPALGGKDTGPAPFEILCSALGACTAITLRMYAERKAWPLRGVQVDVHPDAQEWACDHDDAGFILMMA
jgi:putative redox protein